MSLTSRPLKRELSRLGPISPEIDPILDKIYEALGDPTYEGDPTGMLLLIDEMLGEHDSMFKFQQRHGLEEAEPDPGLFPENSGFETAALLAPEALNAELLSTFNSSAYLERMMQGGPVARTLAKEPSFSEVLERIDSFLGKPLDSGVGTVTGEPEKKPRWTRRKLEPAKKRVDNKPKRLGPEGTWMNDAGDEGSRTKSTLVQGSRTVTTLERQDTLKD